MTMCSCPGTQQLVKSPWYGRICEHISISREDDHIAVQEHSNWSSLMVLGPKQDSKLLTRHDHVFLSRNTATGQVSLLW